MFFKRRPTYPVKRAGLVHHELDGEALLYDTADNVTHRLNDTAYFIWQHCDGTRDTAELASLLTQRYDVDQDVALRDVAASLREMTRNKIVDRSKGQVRR